MEIDRYKAVYRHLLHVHSHYTPFGTLLTRIRSIVSSLGTPRVRGGVTGRGRGARYPQPRLCSRGGRRPGRSSAPHPAIARPRLDRTTIIPTTTATATAAAAATTTTAATTITSTTTMMMIGRTDLATLITTTTATTTTAAATTTPTAMMMTTMTGILLLLPTSHALRRPRHSSLARMEYRGGGMRYRGD